MTDELRVARIIDASPEAVFDTFTADEGRLAFYGQDDPTWIAESRCDQRVGGVWAITFGPSRDRLYHHRHVFRVIDRPHRLVLATTERRPDGSSFDFTMQLTFEARDGKTLMTIIQSGFPTDDLRDEHGRGLPTGFARLERAVLTTAR
jgi:uncharacterized protein YndB with AHSA1/START domain